MDRKSLVSQVMSPDEKLADHLKQAEEHLIAAVKLFSKKHPPQRTADYLRRLTKNQEGVTTLLREELIRLRGPIRVGKR